MRMVALWVSMVLLVAGFPSAQGAATVVRLGTVIPAGTIWNNILKEQSAEWSRLTAGRVRLVVMSGTQGDEDAIIRKMRTSGQLQAASLSAVSLALSIDQSFNVFFIPMFYQDYAELGHVMDKLEPLITQRLADKGFVFVNWGSGGWVQVFSKKPAKNLRELKAMKLFTSAGDDLTVQWYKANGFQPVPLSSADMLSSLTTGMIEAVPVTPLSALSFQWYKYTPFMLDVGISPLVGATVVTKKAWDAISEADRAQLMAAAQKTETRFSVEVPRTDAESVAVMQKSGLTVVKADAAALAEFRTVADGFAKTMRDGMVPREVFELAVRERDAYRKQRSTAK